MKKRILVVDDDEDILTILDILFGDEGYEVILLNTGTTAREVQIIHPDVILLDVRIQGFEKRGDQICNEVAEQYQEYPGNIIICRIYCFSTCSGMRR